MTTYASIDQLPPEYREQAAAQIADKRPSRHEALKARPVVQNGKPVAIKPGNWQGSEHDLQAAVFNWAQSSGIPELAMMFAIPNGGHRHPAVAAKMKMEGVCAGVPDLFLSVARGGYHGLYIELKVARNQPTEAQRDWLARLAAHGYKTAVCRDLESVQALVVGYVAV